MKIDFFYFYFLNKNISVTNLEKLLRISEIVLEVCFEGGVSQILNLCPSFNFMLCRKNVLKIYQMLHVFLNKIRTKP